MNDKNKDGFFKTFKNAIKHASEAFKQTDKNERDAEDFSGFEIPLYKEFRSASHQDQKKIVAAFNKHNDLDAVKFDQDGFAILPDDPENLNELNKLTKELKRRKSPIKQPRRNP